MADLGSFYRFAESTRYHGWLLITSIIVRPARGAKLLTDFRTGVYVGLSYKSKFQLFSLLPVLTYLVYVVVSNNDMDDAFPPKFIHL